MTKISALTALTVAKPDDLVAIVDVHDTTMAASGTDKKITVADLIGLAPSGDTSGATDYANINGLISLAGTVTLQAGAFHLGTNTLTFNQNQNMTGPGAAICSMDYTGTAQAIIITISGSFTGGEYAGKFSGFYLSGYSAGSAAVGIQLGDLQGAYMDDVGIAGFKGVGLHVLNSTGDWAEQSNIKCRIVQCGTAGTSSTGAVVFDNSSFDYSNFDFTIVTANGTNCVVLQNNAQLQGVNLRMRGNCYGAASNTAAVIAIDPANTAGNNGSYILNASLDVAMETAGSNTGHYLVYMGSTNTASQFFATGVLTLSNVGPASQGISNASFLPFGFTNIFGDRSQGAILSYGYTWVCSTDGTSTSTGAITLAPYQSALGIYSQSLGTAAWFVANISGAAHYPCLGGAAGYGMGISGNSNGAGHVMFAVQNSAQGGYGVGGAEFTVYDNGNVVTVNSTLDDGSGNAALAGGLATKLRTVTASATLTATDSVVLLNAATLTATLPTAVGITGRTYTVKVVFASTTGTVATTSSQTIDGATTYSLSASHKYVTVASDGANWQIIANN